MAKSLEQTPMDLLPAVLPTSSEDRTLGSKLIKKLIDTEPSLKECEERSIRQTLSNLAGNPASPIARYDHGFGYFLRQEPEVAGTSDQGVVAGGGKD